MELKGNMKRNHGKRKQMEVSGFTANLISARPTKGENEEERKVTKSSRLEMNWMVHFLGVMIAETI